MGAVNPYVLIGTGAVAVGAVVGSFFYGQHIGAQGERAQQADRKALVREVQEAAQTAAAEAIGGIRINNVKQREVITREIVEKPVYRECVHSDAGLRAVNDALVPTGAGDRVVPGADATDR